MLSELFNRKNIAKSAVFGGTLAAGLLLLSGISDMSTALAPAIAIIATIGYHCGYCSAISEEAERGTADETNVAVQPQSHMSPS